MSKRPWNLVVLFAVTFAIVASTLGFRLPTLSAESRGESEVLRFVNIDRSALATPTPAGTPRPIRAVGGSAAPGQTATVVFEIDSQGSENALSFSVNFDQAKLTNPVLAIGSGVPAGMNIDQNITQVGSGRLGVLLDGSNTFTAGTRQVATLQFTVAPGTSPGILPITFGAVPTIQSLSATNGGLLPTTFVSGNITVTGAGSITGVVTYGTTPVGQTAPFVPGVSLAAVGSVPLNAVTNASGAYSLSGFGLGSYTVTPSKAGSVNGSISGLDAARVAQHVAGLLTLNSNQQLAGDATDNGSLSGLDAARIAQFAAGLTNPGLAGQWKFVPASRTYSSVAAPIANENYQAILVGDVTGNWTAAVSRPYVEDVDRDEDYAHPTADTSEMESREFLGESSDGIEVSVPSEPVGKDGTRFVLPISIADTTGHGIVAYEFTVTFDPDVMRPAVAVADGVATLSSGWTIVHNSGTPGVLRVVGFGTQELSGKGALINLHFEAVDATSGGNRANQLKMVSLKLNEGEIGSRVSNGGPHSRKTRRMVDLAGWYVHSWLEPRIRSKE